MNHTIDMGPRAALDVTRMLSAVRHGDAAAESQLYAAIYGELRKIARRYTRNERPDNTLNSTALVHEAYLKLSSGKGSYQDRTHFFAIAARVMKQILIDHARARLAQKHGGGAQKLDLENVSLFSNDRPSELLDLHEALIRLHEFSPRQAQIVEMRFFGGMTETEMSDHFGVSVRTIRRDWTMAKAWLYGELNKK